MMEKLSNYKNAIKLFCGIVFRRVVSWEKGRLLPWEAWEVAKIVWLEDEKIGE